MAYTIDELANKAEMTQRIKAVVKSEEVWDRAWKYCKNLAKFSTTPIELAQYRKMKKYAEDEELTDAVYEALQGYRPDNTNFILSGFDVVGFYYSIALISQSDYKRERTLTYLNDLADYMIDNKIDDGRVLYRNMKKLKKDFPDLADLEKKLTCFKE